MSLEIIDPQNNVPEIERELRVYFKGQLNADLSLYDLPKTLLVDIAPYLYNNWNFIVNSIPSLKVLPPSVLIDGIEKFTGVKNKTVIKSTVPVQPYDTSLNTTLEVNKVFVKIKANQVRLPSVITQRIEKEKARVAAFTRLDFENKRDLVNSLAANYADYVGAGSATYNLIYNRTPIVTNNTPTDNDFEILFNLNELATVLDQLAVSRTINPQNPTSMEYVAGLARKSGLAFTVPTSKFAIPMPYGVTLERLALMYLNDPDRWIEIATLNGLQEPYIDEEGFKLYFVTNGDGNVLYVNDKTNLYINQVVWISSNNQRRSKRTVTNLREIYPGNVEVTLSGDANLDLFTTSAQAVLESFLPGTVNSQQIIYIPSNDPAPADQQLIDVPGVDVFDPLLQISGMDLLLTQDGDLAITEDGDCRIAYGLQNIIQTVKLALTTPQGSLLMHPEYGLKLEVGMSTADVNADDILKSAVQMFENDPTFTGVHSAQVNKDGPGIQVTLVIGISGITQLVPITFSVNR